MRSAPRPVDVPAPPPAPCRVPAGLLPGRPLCRRRPLFDVSVTAHSAFAVKQRQCTDYCCRAL